MSNKRNLKKYIRTVCGDLAAEIVYAAHRNEEFSLEKVRDIVNKIAELQCLALERASFSFDKTVKDFVNAHEYRKAHALYNKAAYDKLRNEFNESVLTIVKAMNEARPKK